MEEIFSGFMPAIKDVEITNQTSMISTNGDLLMGHIIRVVLGNDTEFICSITQDQLQKLYFLILKTLVK